MFQGFAQDGVAGCCPDWVLEFKPSSSDLTVPLAQLGLRQGVCCWELPWKRFNPRAGS